MSSARTSAVLRDDYLRLIQRFPLRRIRTDIEHRKATEVMMPLMGRDDTLSDGEGDYLSSLIVLIADYERQRWPIQLSNMTPLRVLKHLMAERDVSRTALARLIGSSAASMVLRGRRELSKSHIRILSEYFKVSPALFF